MAKKIFDQFEAFQDGTAEQYQELLSLYFKGKVADPELEFMALNCESNKGIFYSKKYNDLRVGKFELQKPLSFNEFKKRLINTFKA